MLKDTWRKTLGDAGFAFTVHDFAGECAHAEVARIAAAAQRFVVRAAEKLTAFLELESAICGE